MNTEDIEYVWDHMNYVETLSEIQIRPDACGPCNLRINGSELCFYFNYPLSLNMFYVYLQKCVLHIFYGNKLPASIVLFVNSLEKTSKAI